MPCYQLLTALRPVGKQQVENIVKKASSSILKDGGVIKRIHRTDEIRFPFTFSGKQVGEKHTKGRWITIDMVTSVQNMKEVESQLKISDDVLRFSTRKTSPTLI
jgi:ribosomal protein S6